MMHFASIKSAKAYGKAVAIIPNYPELISWTEVCKVSGLRIPLGSLPSDFPLAEGDGRGTVCFASPSDRDRALAMIHTGIDDLHRRLRGERKKYCYKTHEYVAGFEYGSTADRPKKGRRKHGSPLSV